MTLRSVASLTSLTAGLTVLGYALLVDPNPVVEIGGLALTCAPAALYVSEPGERTRPRSECWCRGCRPRPRLDRLLRRPPVTHAQVILGRVHGRLHDLRDLEVAAFGRVKSPEVIEHFALTVGEDGTAPGEPDDDDWWNGCWADPELTAIMWG